MSDLSRGVEFKELEERAEAARGTARDDRKIEYMCFMYIVRLNLPKVTAVVHPGEPYWWSKVVEILCDVVYSFMMCCPMAAQEVTGDRTTDGDARGAGLRRHDGMDPGAADAADARDAAFFAGARALLALAPLVFSYQIS